MRRAYVLMTAMPPTKGHLALISFAAGVADTAEVIVCTQPGEPFSDERVDALRAATAGMNVNIHRIHKALPQEPNGADPAFWDMWLDFLLMFGMTPGRDVVVASEGYGADLARISGTEFVPYDIDRVMHPAKATRVRDALAENFADVLPAFQPYVRRRVTVLGAESTGKTTLSKALAAAVNGHWTYEYARPYLTAPGVGTDVTEEKMHAIWAGQRAVHDLADTAALDKAFTVADTDLYATLGFWDDWSGNTPAGLVTDAAARVSDLYLVTSSNIAFEPDAIRYGGDVRETNDSYWIDLCERHHLPYLYLETGDADERLSAAVGATRALTDSLLRDYRRAGAEYAVDDKAA